ASIRASSWRWRPTFSRARARISTSLCRTREAWRSMRDRGFDDRRLLITGGSAGIGLDAAREAVRRGAHVCIAGRSMDRLDAALASLEATRPHPDRIVAAVRMDVRSAAEVEAAVADAIRRLGSLDVLINNAGYAITGYARDLPERAWDD